jgi:hypothetical protein
MEDKSNMKTLLNRQFGKALLRIVLALALLLPGLPPTATAQTTDGLDAWYKFDEAAGAMTFADSSGNYPAATCEGDACPTLGVQGRFDGAAQFDGVNDKVTAELKGPDQPFTLAAWVNYGGATWDSFRTIIEFGDDAPWFGVNAAGQLTLYQVKTGGAVPVQQWVHVAATDNFLYVNGKPVNFISGPVTSDGQGLSIGDETGSSSPWNGLIDDVRIYNRTLSDAEIAQLADPDAGPVVTPQPPPTAPDDNARLIDMTVSIYKAVTTAEARQPYEDLFRLFADAVYEMSNGAHKLRTITIYDNGRFADRASIKWIAAVDRPTATVSGYPGGSRSPGSSLNMGDRIFGTDQIDNAIDNAAVMNTFVTTMAHEWGHFFYGMRDEYTPDSQPGDTPPEPCSVMCDSVNTLDFNLLNFSTAKSTAAVGRTATNNYRTYQASGWETVARPPTDDPHAVRGQRLHWPELAAKEPAADEHPSVELPANRNQARSALNIVWADANAGVRKHRIFLLDISASMGESNRLGSAKLALKDYVDRANAGDMIGLYTFADTHNELIPLTTIDGAATKDRIKADIDAIEAKPGVADREIFPPDAAAIAALKQAASNAAIIDHSIYVIIDGGYTDGPDIFQSVFDDHRADGVPISVFNFSAAPKPREFGNVIELMAHAPTATNPRGVYRHIGNGGFDLPGVQSAGGASDPQASDLIDALGDIDQEYSPVVDINLGTDYDSLDAGERYTTTFFVDSTLDKLEVLVDYQGAIDFAELTLLDPSGAPVAAPVCAGGGGFDVVCYFFVTAPAPGVWELQIQAMNYDIDIDYEALGYVLDGFTYQALLTSQAGDYVRYPEAVVLVASVFEVNRIARAGLTAWVEDPGGDYATLSLKDDGVAPDEEADDGLYSGFLPYDQPGDYYVTAVFDNSAGNAVFTQIGLADVLDPQFIPIADDFDRFASLEIFVDGYASDDHGGVGNETDLLVDNRDVSGHIDTATDVDAFRITSPQSGVGLAAAGALTETFVLRMSDFAFGMNANMLVTTSQGTQEHQTGALAYDQYWTLPLVLTAGEVVKVNVSSQTGAAGGSYAISVGRPLPGEIQPPQSTFALTTNIIGQGAVTANPPGPYTSGQQVTLTASPAQGSLFSGWNGDAGGTTNPLTLTMDGNKNITATFVRQATTQTNVYLPLIEQ